MFKHAWSHIDQILNFLRQIQDSFVNRVNSDAWATWKNQKCSLDSRTFLTKGTFFSYMPLSALIPSGAFERFEIWVKFAGCFLLPRMERRFSFPSNSQQRKLVYWFVMLSLVSWNLNLYQDVFQLLIYISFASCHTYFLIFQKLYLFFRSHLSYHGFRCIFSKLLLLSSCLQCFLPKVWPLTLQVWM